MIGVSHSAVSRAKAGITCFHLDTLIEIEDQMNIPVRKWVEFRRKLMEQGGPCR